MRCFKVHVFCFAAILLLQGASAGERGDKLAKKSVFSGRFPQVMVFRSDYNRKANASFQAWEKFHSTGQGSIKKYLDEELDIKPIIGKYATKFAAKHPESLMLMHLNGEGRNAVRREYVSKKYFPGHWVYFPGTLLSQDIDPAEKTFKVKNTSVFNLKQYIDRKKKVRLPPDMIMVRLDGDGKRIWSESEYVKLINVNKKSSTITVKRGEYFSKSIAHKSGRTYIAPLDAGMWGGWMWYYNLSSKCPKDANGKTAADVLVKELKENFGPGGRLEAIDGIAFDVNYFNAHAKWDVDNDGTSDGGIVEGRNVWRDGDWKFLNDLRAAVGDDFIITADGHHDHNQRAVGVLNGMESEGPVQHNDGFRGFSRMVNIHTYWDQYNTTPYRFRYIVLKFMNKSDMEKRLDLARFAAGSAACLGAATTDILTSSVTRLPEFTMGEAGKPMWLGKPTGPMIRPARSTPDILKGASLVEEFKLEGCRITSNKDGEITFAGLEKEGLKNCTIKLPPIDTPKGDVVVFMEVKSLGPLLGIDEKSSVPRMVHLKADKLPDYGEGKDNKYYANIWGLAGTKGYSILSFYFRRAGGQKLTFKVEVEEQAPFVIRNLTIHNAADTLVREFENGVVLVNPAMEKADFDLTSLFKHKGKYRRIKAGSNQDEAIRKYNDGSVVDDPKKVEIPPINALFLIREQS